MLAMAADSRLSWFSSLVVFVPDPPERPSANLGSPPSGHLRLRGSGAGIAPEGAGYSESVMEGILYTWSTLSKIFVSSITSAGVTSLESGVAKMTV